jgi:uncharacterized membrane protein
MSISTADQDQHNNINTATTSDSRTFSIRKIDGSSTVRWLSKGIEDFKASNINSLLYGMVFVVAGAITIWFTRFNPLYVMVLLTGFYLVGPPVAAGLYDISRRIEKGEQPTFLHAISVLGQNIRCLMGLTLILGTLMVAWTGVASLIVNAFFGSGSGITTLLSGENAIPFSGVLLIGAIILALLASAISLTFLPLLNNRQIGTLTMLAILALIMLAWVRIMVLAINSFIDNAEMISSGWHAILTNPQFLSFLIVFLLVGLIFAGIAFTISVIAVPMIIHRRVNVIKAISTSVKAVRMNPLPMFRWAATIAVLIAVGLSLFFVGLAIAFPIIGHASWHAYRELVIDDVT